MLIHQDIITLSASIPTRASLPLSKQWVLVKSNWFLKMGTHHKLCTLRAGHSTCFYTKKWLKKRRISICHPLSCSFGNKREWKGSSYLRTEVSWCAKSFNTITIQMTTKNTTKYQSNGWMISILKYCKNISENLCSNALFECQKEKRKDRKENLLQSIPVLVEWIKHKCY